MNNHENISKSAQKIAVIDIGSNSIRMSIAEINEKGNVNIILSRRNSSRLASHIGESKIIGEEPFKKSMEILKSYKNIIDKYNINSVKSVATSAVREAENGKDFIRACKDIGLTVDVISGNEEAFFTLKGVQKAIDIIDKKVLLFDIGGGSTEFISAKNDKVFFNESYKIGVVKLTDIFDMKDAAVKNIDKCSAYINDFFKNAPIPTYTEILIGTAGTATTLAAIDMEMIDYEPIKINGYSISKINIENILDKVISLPYEKRSFIKGLEKGREDLIIPGILITLEAMNKTGKNKLTVSDYGLKEGLIVSASHL